MKYNARLARSPEMELRREAVIPERRRPPIGLILVAVVGVALVTGFLVGPRVTVMCTKSKGKTEVYRLLDAVERGLRVYGVCPADVQSLSTIDPFLNTNDPWSTRMRLTCTSYQIEVRSAGADRLFGDTDDIVMRTKIEPLAPPATSR